MMVDLLWHARRPLRRSGARAKNYLMARDKPGGGKHDTTSARRTRPPTTYNYVVKVVHDPLSCGAFNAGTVFTLWELDCMLLNNSFTPGTSLIVRGKLVFVHGDGDNERQCTKRFKPK